jgi:hypothetical protein
MFSKSFLIKRKNKKRKREPNKKKEKTDKQITYSFPIPGARG